MSTFLVVLDQGVSVHGLRYGLLDHVSQHKPAELVLLQPLQRSAGQSEAKALQTNQEALDQAVSLLDRMGLPIADGIVGDALPRKAILQEIGRGEYAYEGILLTEQAPAFLRLLQFDPARQLERRLRMPVEYVAPDLAGQLVGLAAFSS